jgi:glycine/D-amino acid oxidase-like deaminating enzyme
VTVPDRCDVAIVGGGFAGCATAWALAARGVRAVVLERATELGRFASGRGAGLGRQLADDDATSALTMRGAAQLRSELAAAWTPTGGVLAFDATSHAQGYMARAARLGVAHEVLGRAGVLARWPQLSGLGIASAIYVPGDGVIDPLRLLALYAERCDVRCGVTVERIAEGVVQTSAGTIAAKVIVDASGAWAGELTGDPPLDVYRRHLYVLEAGSAGAPFLWHLGTEELYVRPAGDGTLISVCDSTPTTAGEQEIDPACERLLRTRLASTAPTLAGSAVVRGWACQRAFTPDRMMRLGRDPRRPWLVWAVGLGGHGATASAAVGETVADAVLAAL